MGKTKRDKLRRELAQALHHLEVAQNDIGVVWQAFDGHEDGYATSLAMIGQSIDAVKGQIRSFWLWAWGKVPDNFDSYRI